MPAKFKLKKGEVRQIQARPSGKMYTFVRRHGNVAFTEVEDADIPFFSSYAEGCCGGKKTNVFEQVTE